MNLATEYFRELGRGAWSGWNRFWFAAADPATLSVVRILAGAMLFYTHLVWTLELDAFFGQEGWIPVETIQSFPGHTFWQWSYFHWIDSPAVLWTAHFAALAVFFLLTIGLFSRTMAVLAFLAAVSYIRRASLAQFGLDDTNVMLAMYLMVGPCGADYSVDRWLKRRKASPPPAVAPSIGANLAIRLMQVHMCVIYLFSGIAKISGQSWWDGSATWLAIANLEYQSFDITWLAAHPWLLSLLTHLTVFWETFYCALVWPRLTRPIVLAIAVAVHLGIGMFLGMWTFGLAMIIGNFAFVSPWVVRRVLDRAAAAGPAMANAEAAGSGSRRRRPAHAR